MFQLYIRCYESVQEKGLFFASTILLLLRSLFSSSSFPFSSAQALGHEGVDGAGELHVGVLDGDVEEAAAATTKGTDLPGT